MPLSTQAQALVSAMAASGMPPFWSGSPESARQQMAAFGQMIPPGPELNRVQDLRISSAHGALPARLYVPKAQPAALLVYFHGGGWVFGSLNECDATCRHLALTSGCALLSIDYRLAPEHPFPAAVDDVFDAFRWAAENQWAWGKLPLIVIGDSAGGNLGAVVALLARDGGTPKIAGQILIYPVLSAAMNSPSYHTCAAGPTVGADAMRWFFDLYAPDAASRVDWRCSPALAKLGGLPPALVITAEFDPLRDEGEDYAKALRRSGTLVQLTRYDGVPHGFFTMPGLLDESLLAIKESATWIRSLLASS